MSGFGDTAALIAILRKYERCMPKNHIPYIRATGEITEKTLGYCKSYVVLDFETTGLSPKNDKPIEIAMIRYTRDGLEDAVYTTLINPERSIPPQITKLTGITDDAVKNKPIVEMIAADIRDFIGGGPVVAHNAPFDVAFLKTAFASCGITDSVAYLDTLKLSRQAFPNLENYRLETLIAKFNLMDKQTHRALDDVRCTEKVLRKCLEMLNAGI